MSSTAAATLPEQGSTLPRLFSPPAATGAPGPCGCGCALTDATTYGFRVARFAEHVLKMPLDPWQRWLVIHAGELNADGTQRFKKVLVIVARQNGKTHLLKVLALYWMFVEQWAMILGQSTTLSTAKESWEGAQDLAAGIPELAAEFGTVRRDNNDPHWKAAGGSKYRIAASTRKGGRGLPVDRLIVDELREQQTWVAYSAAMPTMNARPLGQAWLITNQGDDQSVVLNSLRKSFLAAVTGEGADDLAEDLGGFEWSAKEGADPREPSAIASANPNVGRRLSMRTLLADARRAMANGGEEETSFRTEILCQRVHALDAAVDPESWAACLELGNLEALRSRVAFCLDVSPDQRHITLAAAAEQPDGRVRVELVASWQGTVAARRELPALLAAAKPRVFGWFPAGPAASMAATLADRGDGTGGSSATRWPPAGVRVEEIRGDVAAVCMGFSELVAGKQVAHSGEALLDAHVLAAARLWKGDAWRFSRKGDGHCDAAYAVAGAAHLARTLPPGLGVPRLVVAK